MCPAVPMMMDFIDASVKDEAAPSD